MRRLTFLGAAMLTLVGSGIAVAHEGTRSADTDAVTATLAAERTKVTERTCTTPDGTYRVANEHYRGTATSSDPRLAGALVLKTRSFVNGTTGLGRTSGHAEIRGTDGDLKAKLSLVGVNTDRTVLNGVLTGHVRAAGDRARGALTANFRTVSSSATALTLELGGAAAQNPAIVQSFSGCPDREDGEAKARVVVKRGEVTALSATSLSVKVGDATIVFALTDRLAKLVEHVDLAIGNRVEIAYAIKGDTVTLLKLRKV